MAVRGNERGRGCCRGHGGPEVAAISITDVKNMVDTLLGIESAFLPNTSLIDRGADITIR